MKYQMYDSKKTLKVGDKIGEGVVSHVFERPEYIDYNVLIDGETGYFRQFKYGKIDYLEDTLNCIAMVIYGFPYDEIDLDEQFHCDRKSQDDERINKYREQLLEYSTIK